MKNEQPKEDKGTNPILAISIAIVLSLTLSGISLLVFLRSDTRETVRLIQQQSNDDASEEGISSEQPVTVEDLERIVNDVSNLQNSLPEEPIENQYSDQILGL